MGALAFLVPMAAAGATIAARQMQAQQSRASSVAQVQVQQQQEVAQQRVVQAQQAAQVLQNRQQLARSLASARARAGAAGVQPDAGSAAALGAGLVQDAVDAQGASNDVFTARLAAGRASLLQPDGSMTALLRSGRQLGSLGSSTINLLDPNQ